MRFAQDNLETVLGPEFGRLTPDSHYPRPASGKPCRSAGGPKAGKFTLAVYTPRPDGDGDQDGQVLLTFADPDIAVATCRIFAMRPAGLPVFTLDGDEFNLVVNDAAGGELARFRLHREPEEN